MPSTPPTPTTARSADALNEQIRALMTASAGRLNDAQRKEYQVLVEAWSAAVRAELVKAA
ncbi:hypothetical protein DY218_14035 [Streptomyces triticagri]|uniref:Uncharacterized protein n=1 Tax=Streptomyces triticagri TaxID=2293568 RepID=A0A372M6E2_9ACTN|nr:hypothetical protein DY218_14035 [Streptomyces triticagri]